MDAGSAFSSLPPETDRRLYYLKRLKGTDWVPPAIMVLDRYKDDPAQARRLIGEIDRLAHLLRLMCLGTGKRTRRFAAVVQAIRDGSALAPEAPCFQLSREEMRSITFNLKDIYGRAPLFSKLVLMRLGDVLDGRLAPLEPGDVTVEHVMPQRPGQHSDWRRTIADPELREAATKSIGNLAVVPQAVNDRARNQEFDRKRELYASSHPMPPLLAEIAAAPEWTLEVIKSREDRLLGALAALWRLDVKGAALPG
jgi:hypothetical protein